MEELDAFRAELLRQRVVFEAELRRQNEYFEARLQAMSRELADREADCRNLQSVVTILGKKIDSLAEQRERPMSRHPSATRSIPSERNSDDRLTRVGSAGRRPPSPLVAPAPAAVPLNRLKPLSRTTSPRPPLPNSSGTYHQRSASARSKN